MRGVRNRERPPSTLITAGGAGGAEDTGVDAEAEAEDDEDEDEDAPPLHSQAWKHISQIPHVYAACASFFDVPVTQTICISSSDICSTNSASSAFNRASKSRSDSVCIVCIVSLGRGRLFGCLRQRQHCGRQRPFPVIGLPRPFDSTGTP